MLRRRFLTRAGAGALALAPASALARSLAEAESMRTHVARAVSRSVSPFAGTPDDEPFWAEVREAFDLDPAVLNLDNGWTNPTPRAAMDVVVAEGRRLEALPAERLVAIWEEVSNTHVRSALAETLGVPGSEIALVRNATEALDTVLLGVPLRAGDEVVCSAHDYYAMLDALDQRRERDGVVLRMVHPPVPAPSMDSLEALYRDALTPRTRLVLLTNPSNLTGQHLPVRRIAEAAHAVGAEVVVDGAQSLGLEEGSIADLGCDYYGASAHKWLGTPVGLGVLWMRPEHAVKVWPLIPPGASATGMGRFEWIGTGPEYVSAGALPALELHRALGPARKAARLGYLGAHWRALAAGAFPGARFYTVPEAGAPGALSVMELPGRDSAELQTALRRDHGILVQAMNGARAPEIAGLRVTPNVYHTPTELERFVAALEEVG